MLVDGGLSFDLPEGQTVETVLAATLGPAAARVSMTLESEDAYLGFWRQHPAFAGEVNDDVVNYALSDLHGSALEFRPFVVHRRRLFRFGRTVRQRRGRDRSRQCSRIHPADRPARTARPDPALYDAAAVERSTRELPLATIPEVPDVNHYTIVMSSRGAGVIAAHIRAQIGA